MSLVHKVSMMKQIFSVTFQPRPPKHDPSTNPGTLAPPSPTTQTLVICDSIIHVSQWAAQHCPGDCTLSIAEIIQPHVILE